MGCRTPGVDGLTNRYQRITKLAKRGWPIDKIATEVNLDQSAVEFVLISAAADTDATFGSDD